MLLDHPANPFGLGHHERYPHEENTLPAVIRISGNRASLAAAIPHCGLPFQESGYNQRRRRLDPAGRHTETTYNLAISDADGDAVPQQIRDVELFLGLKGSLLADLIRSLDDCACEVDFSWDFPRDAIGQFNWFPAELMVRLVELKIDLKISVYGIGKASTLYEDG